ncbi:hypothetical protein E2C01_042576 [Portunus trituberculatus]|uniref:Uncharacterized protein n=1 Tax=Portunus trituberculatus TaxID=210409 RepID=A0A5B7FV18_PORTR|nr:hypothetical protein [Portunus trituberculatus]
MNNDGTRVTKGRRDEGCCGALPTPNSLKVRERKRGRRTRNREGYEDTAVEGRAWDVKENIIKGRILEMKEKDVESDSRESI